MNDISYDFKKALTDIKNTKPLIHNITNFVTMQDCANIIAATGASPVMAYYSGEVEEITSISKALVINMGTPDPERFVSAIKAGKAANKKNIPIVFDPVGIGASLFRRKNINKFLEQVKPDIIKGNISEIKVLAGITSAKTKGVDSTESADKNLETEVFKLAKAWKCIIAATGKTDIITDGIHLCKIDRGSSMLGDISGSGCMAASLTGCFCAVEKNYFKACVNSILAMNLAGECSEDSLNGIDGTGMFKLRLFDIIYNMHKADLDLQSNIHM